MIKPLGNKPCNCSAFPSLRIIQSVILLFYSICRDFFTQYAEIFSVDVAKTANTGFN
jgi:hypothetical protein